MTVPPKRRWLRFGLRTMFVVVTVVACGFGYVMRQWGIMQERKAVLAEIEREWAESGISPVDAYLMHEASEWPPEISRIRRLLGDTPKFAIEIPPTLAANWIERTENAFPETKLHIFSRGKYGGLQLSDYRDSIYMPTERHKGNIGSIFKTGRW